MLTPRQSEVYRYLVDTVCQEGRQPSYREMQEHFGWNSPNAATCHLAALERKGWIRRRKGKAAGLVILRHRFEAVEAQA